MSPYSYHAYGLNFVSGFPLPELRPAKNDKPDVTIRFGKVPETLPFRSDFGLAWQSAPGKLLLTVSEIARYLLVENEELIVEPLPGVSEDDMRTFMLGSVMGALLHARQILVLHASVIKTDRGAVLFMGKSGAGKSTLLASFIQRGYAMLTDDKAAIVVSKEGVAQVIPSFPYARLKKESADELKFPVKREWFKPKLEKYVYPVENFCAEPLRVHAAFSIKAHNKNGLLFEVPSTLDSFHVLNRHTYRRRFLHQDSQRKAHFESLGVLSQQTKVTTVFRPDNTKLIGELTDRLEESFLQ